MSDKDEASKIKAMLDLAPLPLEGGWLRELRIIQTEGQKSLEGGQKGEERGEVKSSSIYYMLQGKEVSRWHRCINTEEYFCWHRGTAPIKIYELDEKDGDIKTFRLGDPLVHSGDVRLQHLRREGIWTALELDKKEGSDYALITAVTAPAYDWENFQILTEEKFDQKFPQHKGKFAGGFFH